MSKSTKSAGGDATGPAELPFEEALQKLESIVESMEGDNMPLESLLAHFEEGTRLAKQCQAKLADAEVKIQQLEQNAAGELKLKPVSVADVKAPIIG